MLNAFGVGDEAEGGDATTLISYVEIARPLRQAWALMSILLLLLSGVVMSAGGTVTILSDHQYHLVSLAYVSKGNDISCVRRGMVSALNEKYFAHETHSATHQCSLLGPKVKYLCLFPRP